VRNHGDGVVASVTDADLELETTLDNLDDAHHYRQWIFDLIEPSLGAHVLEIGAGHGTFTELLAQGRRVTATDLSPRCVGVLSERFAGRPEVTVLLGDVEGARSHGPYDSVVMINVLEHIDDDGAALAELRRQLNPSGRIAIWVPAHMQLYSRFDRLIGHHRRYTRGQLVELLTESGFAVDDAFYVNMVGAAAWWLVARVLGRVPTGRVLAGLFDRFAVPVVRRAEARCRPPAGQSVLALARRAETVDSPDIDLTERPRTTGDEGLIDMTGPAVAATAPAAGLNERTAGDGPAAAST